MASTSPSRSLPNASLYVHGSPRAVHVVADWGARQIESSSGIKVAWRERNILQMIDSPFLPKLHWAFQVSDVYDADS